jgi:hypothetical protein
MNEHLGKYEVRTSQKSLASGQHIGPKNNDILVFDDPSIGSLLYIP